jgi:hypothetical protein
MKRYSLVFAVISVFLFADVCICNENVEVKYFDKTFLRAAAKPVTESNYFTGNSGPAIIKVSSLSLESSAIEKTNSSIIILNGHHVFDPSDFRKKVTYLEKVVVLQNGANSLEVCLRGKPGESIRIQIIQQFSCSIDQNATWAGVVTVNGPVNVESGTTLTIAPGTRVQIKHYRGYREPEKRLHFIVQGRIVAEGTAQNPIYFTSDALDPQNGDWAMLRLVTPSGQCIFRYCVFEFAQQGLNVWQGDVVITNCVFRWSNWEGIYFESASNATMESCQIYENGYNGLAAEQFNAIDMDNCEIWRNGTSGVHVDATTLEILRSRVHHNRAHGLSVDDNGTLHAYGVAIYENDSWGIGSGQGTNIVQVSNLDMSGNKTGDIDGPYTAVASSYYPPASINIGFEADQSNALGYIPSDPLLDKYMYVYPDDETRRIVRKIGVGLGLTWSLAWDGTNIWTANLDGKVYKLDPLSGNVLQQFDAPGSQPWGMTFDGTNLWLVDFAEKRISKINPATGKELASYATPDPAGGCKGVTWDGTYLNVMGWTSPTIYRMDQNGNLIGTIQLDRGGGGIAWDGSHFWIPAGKIVKYDTQGHAVGWIYPASEGTWDLTWDGQHLWAAQRTNENWGDEKIFALEVLELKAP